MLFVLVELLVEVGEVGQLGDLLLGDVLGPDVVVLVLEVVDPVLVGGYS